MSNIMHINKIFPTFLQPEFNWFIVDHAYMINFF